MTVRGSESGFAIALLLWMIAGMSLTVAAVIHFASADIGMAELRLREAKARAMGRGAALLALRDNVAKAYLPEDPNSPADDAVAEDSSEQSEKIAEYELQSEKTAEYELQSEKTAEYELISGWTILVTIHPSNGYVSLNDADPESLEMLLVELGGLEASDAAAMAQGVIDYRYDFPGFRYTEELLAVEGVSRLAYDKVKKLVHPFRSGQTDASNSPAALKALLAGGEAGQGDQTSGEAAKPATMGGPMTFESIAAEIEQRAGVSDTTIVALELKHILAGGPTLNQQIWVSPERDNQLLRVGAVTSEADGPQ